MTRDDIYAFLKRNPVFVLATADNTIPHARAMIMYHVDHNGIIFTTDRNKDLYRQLTDNPSVELCFINVTESVQVRVSGMATMLEAQELQTEICDLPDDESAVSFRVQNGIASVWAYNQKSNPKTTIEL